MSLSFSRNPLAVPDTERSSQPSSGLHNDSFAILNEHKNHLSKLYFSTNTDDEYINAIKEWKDDYLKVNQCPLRRLAGFRECYKNKAIENAEAKDIKLYIKNNFIPTGGKRKSLLPHKKSKKRKQTKHMKKGKNGKKSKTKKVKRSRH